MGLILKGGDMLEKYVCCFGRRGSRLFFLEEVLWEELRVISVIS